MLKTLRSVSCLAVALSVTAPSLVSAQQLTTTFVGNNTFAGNMFNVSVLSAGALQFTGMNVNVGEDYDAPGSGSGLSAVISIWTRAGGYEGAEYDEGAWTARGSYNVTAAGANVPTYVDFADFQLASGSLTGFYVSLTNYGEDLNMIYTNGVTSYSNSDLQIDAGIGRGDPDFEGSTFAGRIWNGTLYYDGAVVSVPEPASFLLVTAGLIGLVAARRRRSTL